MSEVRYSRSTREALAAHRANSETLRRSRLSHEALVAEATECVRPEDDGTFAVFAADGSLEYVDADELARRYATWAA